MRTNYPKTAAAAELKLCLKDLPAKVERIVVVGLGCPSKAGEEHSGTFNQLAMIEVMKKALESDPKHPRWIPVFYCDPDIRPVGDRFMTREFSAQKIAHKGKRDDVPQDFYFSIQGKEIYDKTFQEHTDIEGTVKETTASTVLFLPFVPARVALRIIEATKPRLIITHSLQVLWDNTILVQPSGNRVNPEAAKQFGKTYLKAMRAWDILTDKYWRKDLKQEKYWAYMPVNKGDEVKFTARGWLKETRCTLDLDEWRAERVLLDSDRHQEAYSLETDAIELAGLISKLADDAQAAIGSSEKAKAFAASLKAAVRDANKVANGVGGVVEDCRVAKKAFEAERKARIEKNVQASKNNRAQDKV